MDAVDYLDPLGGVVHACAALGVNRARVYRVRARRCHLAGTHVRRGPRPQPPLALTSAEQDALLRVLNSERFADMAPASIHATLFDEGRYLGSVRTMYRLLASCDAVRERRNQLTHPVYTKPELLATGACEVWSWDITKLKGPGKWTCFHLYVILDIFSRYVVGWLIAARESAELAEQLIGDTAAKQLIAPGTLTLHADRGTSMRSKTVAQLLVDLEITKTHSRPHVSDDNPYSEAQFRTMKYRPDFPEPIRLHRGCAHPLPALLRLVQLRTPPQRHWLHDARNSSLRSRRRGLQTALGRLGRRLRASPKAFQGHRPATARAAHRSLDQSPEKGAFIQRTNLNRSLIIFYSVSHSH